MFSRCLILWFHTPVVRVLKTSKWVAMCCDHSYCRPKLFTPLTSLEDLCTSKGCCSDIISHQRQENKHAPNLSLFQARFWYVNNHQLNKQMIRPRREMSTVAVAVFICTLCLCIKAPFHRNRKGAREILWSTSRSGGSELVGGRALLLHRNIACSSNAHSMTTHRLMSSSGKDREGLRESFSEMVRIMRPGTAISLPTPQSQPLG